MTPQEAIALYDSKFWETMPYADKAKFQLFEDRLCMPFAIYHEAVEKTLGRPVLTHELGLARERLQKELLGDTSTPSLQQLLELIAADKRIILTHIKP
jgi:hypothetical protein